LMAGVKSSNPAEGMNVRLLYCVCSGLCDGLITSAQESYRVCLCF
jgi:hypothetical protein